MSSGNFDLTTYYAKRIIGDAAAATAANALLQTGDDITSNTWILHRTNRTTEIYGIHYAYDGTNGHDKIEFYGEDNVTAWVQLDTGNTAITGTLETGNNISVGTTSITAERALYVKSNSGIAAIYSTGNSSSNGLRGLWFGAHGDATASLSAVVADTNTNVWHVARGVGAMYILKTVGEPWPCIRFDAVAGGSNYVTTDQDGWAQLYCQVPAKRASDDFYYSTQFFFREYSKTANSTTRGSYYETYFLPAATDGLSTNPNYDILTTKDLSFSITGNAATATRIQGNLAQATTDVNRNIWVSSGAGADGIPNYVSGFYINPSTNILSVPGNLRLHRESGTGYARLHFYSTFKTWSIYMSNAAASGCPSGGVPSTLGNVTAWALRSYIEDATGYGWIWESAAEANTGTPTARMALSSSDGTLEVAGVIKSTSYSNTVTFGSQNASWCHIYNSADIPFIFNKSVQVVGKASLGGTTYPWGNIYIGGANNGIYFVGTKQTYRMIRFIDNTAGADGNGIVIGGGGLTMLGSGESVDTLFNNVGASGGTETTYISSDNTIEFLPTQQNGYDVSAHFTMTDGRFWAGVNGNTTRETSVGAQSGAGQIYMWSHAATSGSRGIYVPAHGTGAAKTVLGVDTNNNVTFYGTLSGTATNTKYFDNWYGGGKLMDGCAPTATLQGDYGSAGRTIANMPSGWVYGGLLTLSYDTIVSCGCQFAWDVRHNTANAGYLWFRSNGTGGGTNNWKNWCAVLTSDNYSSYAVALSGGTMTGNILGNKTNTLGSTAAANHWRQIYLGGTTADSKALNSANPLIEFSNSDRSQYAQILYTDFNNQGGTDSITFVSNQTDLRVYAPKVHGAVWNDYAECRKTEDIEPGYCLMETETGIMKKCNKRMTPGCHIISDTYGMLIGETHDAKSPIAVSGRVLVYTKQNRNNYPLGAPVCAAEDGTIDLMTREEIINYPECIIGIVSEIPTYDIWYAGQYDEDTQHGRLEIPVNGRIWIYVR